MLQNLFVPRLYELGSDDGRSTGGNAAAAWPKTHSPQLILLPRHNVFFMVLSSLYCARLHVVGPALGNFLQDMNSRGAAEVLAEAL